jgi:hypothetical protein
LTELIELIELIEYWHIPATSPAFTLQTVAFFPDAIAPAPPVLSSAFASN